jgi:hypothetical protein
LRITAPQELDELCVHVKVGISLRHVWWASVWVCDIAQEHLRKAISIAHFQLNCKPSSSSEDSAVIPQKTSGIKNCSDQTGIVSLMLLVQDICKANQNNYEHLPTPYSSFTSACSRELLKRPITSFVDFCLEN